MGGLEDKLALLSIMALPFLLAVTLHEAGHAYCAYFLGDKTPKIEGRLSFNPLRHIDPMGTILIPLLALFAGIPFLIGYAKPVMINPRAFRAFRRDMILVALAGPAGNLLVGIFCAYVIRFSNWFDFGQGAWLSQTMVMGIWLNALFMVFNLMPIPPLDGSKIVSQLLPAKLARSYDALAPFGFFILMGVIILFRDIIFIPAAYSAGLIAWLVGVQL